MGGMEMLMKSFGVDPENIKKQVEAAGEDFKKVVVHFNNRLDKIESEITAINANQLKIMTRLDIEPVLAPNNGQLSHTHIESGEKSARQPDEGNHNE